MTDIIVKEYSELTTLHKRIKWLPERHPYPVKCMLYLVFNASEPPYWPWAAVYKVLERMGYIPVKVEESVEGNGVAFTTEGWTSP